MPQTETRLFGIRVFASNVKEASASVVALALRGIGGHVCVSNVDMVTRAKRDPKLRATMTDAALVVTDGVPLVWMLRKLGHREAERVYGPALTLQLCSDCQDAGLAIYLYGGTEAEVTSMVVALNKRFPRLHIAGAVSPPMLPANPPLDLAIARSIDGSGAALVFVGLGCPKQEYWMANHAGHLRAVTVGVGLAFAQIAGLKAPAPAWMSNNGLEWVFRLCQEPRRLWRRYLVGNSLFLWYCLEEFAGRVLKRNSNGRGHA